MSFIIINFFPILFFLGWNIFTTKQYSSKPGLETIFKAPRKIFNFAYEEKFGFFESHSIHSLGVIDQNEKRRLKPNLWDEYKTQYINKRPRLETKYLKKQDQNLPGVAITSHRREAEPIVFNNANQWDKSQSFFRLFQTKQKNRNNLSNYNFQGKKWGKSQLLTTINLNSQFPLSRYLKNNNQQRLAFMTQWTKIKKAVACNQKQLSPLKKSTGFGCWWSVRIKTRFLLRTPTQKIYSLNKFQIPLCFSTNLRLNNIYKFHLLQRLGIIGTNSNFTFPISFSLIQPFLKIKSLNHAFSYNYKIINSKMKFSPNINFLSLKWQINNDYYVKTEFLKHIIFNMNYLNPTYRLDSLHRPPNFNIAYRPPPFVGTEKKRPPLLENHYDFSQIKILPNVLKIYGGSWHSDNYHDDYHSVLQKALKINSKEIIKSSYAYHYTLSEALKWKPKHQVPPDLKKNKHFHGEVSPLDFFEEKSVKQSDRVKLNHTGPELNKKGSFIYLPHYNNKNLLKRGLDSIQNQGSLFFRNNQQASPIDNLELFFKNTGTIPSYLLNYNIPIIYDIGIYSLAHKLASLKFYRNSHRDLYPFKYNDEIRYNFQTLPVNSSSTYNFKLPLNNSPQIKQWSFLQKNRQAKPVGGKNNIEWNQNLVSFVSKKIFPSINTKHWKNDQQQNTENDGLKVYPDNINDNKIGSLPHVSSKASSISLIDRRNLSVNQPLFTDGMQQQTNSNHTNHNKFLHRPLKLDENIIHNVLQTQNYRSNFQTRHFSSSFVKKPSIFFSSSRYLPYFLVSAKTDNFQAKPFDFATNSILKKNRFQQYPQKFNTYLPNFNLNNSFYEANPSLESSNLLLPTSFVSRFFQDDKKPYRFTMRGTPNRALFNIKQQAKLEMDTIINNLIIQETKTTMYPNILPINSLYPKASIPFQGKPGFACRFSADEAIGENNRVSRVDSDFIEKTDIKTEPDEVHSFAKQGINDKEFGTYSDEINDNKIEIQQQAKSDKNKMSSLYKSLTIKPLSTFLNQTIGYEMSQLLFKNSAKDKNHTYRPPPLSFVSQKSYSPISESTYHLNSPSFGINAMQSDGVEPYTEELRGLASRWTSNKLKLWQQWDEGVTSSPKIVMQKKIWRLFPTLFEPLKFRFGHLNLPKIWPLENYQASSSIPFQYKQWNERRGLPFNFNIAQKTNHRRPRLLRHNLETQSFPLISHREALPLDFSEGRSSVCRLGSSLYFDWNHNVNNKGGGLDKESLALIKFSPFNRNNSSQIPRLVTTKLDYINEKPFYKTRTIHGPPLKSQKESISLPNYLKTITNNLYQNVCPNYSFYTGPSDFYFLLWILLSKTLFIYLSLYYLKKFVSFLGTEYIRNLFKIFVTMKFIDGNVLSIIKTFQDFNYQLNQQNVIDIKVNKQLKTIKRIS